MRTNFIPRNAFLYLQVFAFTLARSHGLQLDFWALAVIQAADGWKCSLKSVCGWWITPYTWPLLHTRHQTQSEHYQPQKPCQASPYLERFLQGLLYGQMAKSGECRKPAKQKREWLKSTGLVGTGEERQELCTNFKCTLSKREWWSKEEGMLVPHNWRKSPVPSCQRMP